MRKPVVSSRVPHHNLHPLLVELDAALEKATQAYDDHPGSGSVRNFLKETASSMWTEAIEGAIGDANKLQAVKQRRDDALLLFESAFCSSFLARQRLSKERANVATAISNLVAHSRQLQRDDKWRWDLRVPIIQMSCLEAEEFLQSSTGRLAEDYTDYAEAKALTDTHQEAVAVLLASFRELASLLKQHPKFVDPLDSGWGLPSLIEKLYLPARGLVSVEYTSEFRRSDLAPIEFAFDLQDEHATADSSTQALNELTELMQQLHEACGRIKHAHDELKKRNGYINEKQYANDLVEYLNGKHCDVWAGNTKKRQTDNRLHHQHFRVVLDAELLGAECLRHQVVDTLRRAVECTESLMQDEKDHHHLQILEHRCHEGPFRCLADYQNDPSSLKTYIAMLNCLAADRLLIRCGLWMQTVHTESRKDYSNGMGTKTMAAAFHMLG